MYAKSLLSIGAVVTGALAQTPPGTSPSTSNSLGVQFGSHKVTPYEILRASEVSSAPTISLPSQQQGTFMVFMLDLDITDQQVVSNAGNNASAVSSLTPGYGTGRTTRLHWWQGNLTQSTGSGGSNGSFARAAGSPDGPAPYAGPKPPSGDVPHAYTLYLFAQPASYAPPAYAAAGSYDNTSTAARFNFSLADTVAQVGQPVAANYFGGVNDNGNYSSPPNGTGTAGGPSASSSGTPSGSATASAPSGTGTNVAAAAGARVQVASALVLGAAGAFAVLI